MLKSLSERLTADFGQGFTPTNLRYMRQFHLAFPKCHALRDELSWTHYRLLLKVENAESRNWYAEEAAKDGWSTRALDRQIASRYHERLLSNSDQAPVRSEAASATEKLTPRDILKDPYTYVRIYEEQHRSSDDNPTIGLILCTEKNEAVARYSVLADGKQIFASKYQLVLPSEQELAQQLQKEIKELEAADNQSN